MGGEGKMARRGATIPLHQQQQAQTFLDASFLCGK
jgi:hypothetical protein